jgi:hypothetical protein
MPEPDTDQFRESAGLSFGQKKPNPYPTKPYIWTTDDEAYQFRRPDEAYNTGGPDGQLPDGLKTDGTYPRRWGGPAITKEGNG